MADGSVPDTVFNNEDDYTVTHPLNDTWAMFFDDPGLLKGRNATDEDWRKNVKKLLTFSDVESFWRLYNSIKGAHELMGCNLHLFKDGIEPMWEDTANKNGGKWVFIVPKSVSGKLDDMWLNTMLALIGNQFHEYSDEVNGAVVSIRAKQHKISVWTKNSSNKEAAMAIAKKWKELVNIKDEIAYESHAAAISKSKSYGNIAMYRL